MLSILTSYLLQTGKCALPHIGFFNTIIKPAVTDIVNKQILPPLEEIIFTEETILLTSDLVKDISFKKKITETDASLELNDFCKEWKEKIDNGERMCFEKFGYLKKNDLGNIIFFKEESYSYYKPVPAYRVVHLNAGHGVLVGDKQTTSAAMNKYYDETPVVTKKGWRIWALVLFAIGLFILIYSFYNNKLSTSTAGNRSHFTIKAAEQTHFELSE